MSARIKRICLPGVIVAALYVVLVAAAAHAEVVHNFHADITINPDASIDVAETIDMDFEGDEKHGIYRQIPVQYERHNASYTLAFDLKSVQVDGADSTAYEVQRQGPDELIRIGNPDSTLTGDHTYKIAYHVRRALNFTGEDHAPELYWNVTGNAWQWPIEHADANVYAPSTVPLGAIHTASYYGPVGSQEHARQSQGAQFESFEADQLAAGDGLTVVEALPAESIKPPPAGQEFFDALIDWWPAVFFPPVTLLVMFVLWWETGRDEDAHHPIAVEWNPPTGLSPAEVGTLVDESCDTPDVVSTLIDLAVRGYLRIRVIPPDEGLLKAFHHDDYEFTKTIPPQGDKLLPHENKFLNAVFASGDVVRLSYLNGKFSATITSVTNDVYQSLTDKKLFHGNPNDVRIKYSLIAGLLFIVGVFSGGLGAPWVVAFIGTSVVIGVFTKAMPSRTAEGSRLTRQCLGFARYVRLAEKDRIRVLAADDPTLFGRMLPYAMVLGAADEWAKAFDGLLQQPPDWYVPYGYNNSFSTYLFVSDLGQGMRSMQSSLIAAPPSTSTGSSAISGGSGLFSGFSGGGFGGGGGGSW